LADASAELELSEGISSNVVERFRRFEKEVSVLALWVVCADGSAQRTGQRGQRTGRGSSESHSESEQYPGQ